MSDRANIFDVYGNFVGEILVVRDYESEIAVWLVTVGFKIAIFLAITALFLAGFILYGLGRALFALLSLIPRKPLVGIPLLIILLVGGILGYRAYRSYAHPQYSYSYASASFATNTPAVAAQTSNTQDQVRLTATAQASATERARIVPTPTAPPPRPAYTPMPGSWIASAPTSQLRFFAAPQWVPKPELTAGTRSSFGSVSSGGDFQAFDIDRLTGMTGSNSVTGWNEELNSIRQWSTVSGLTVTSDPRPQQAAGFGGFIGQYHYIQPGNGVRIDGTLWVGQVNGDRVVMNFRCDPAQDQQLDGAVAQVLATIDFNAS